MIFILSAVSLHQNTKEDIQRNCRIHNLTHRRHDPLEKYVKFLSDAGRLHYQIETYDTAYFTDSKSAQEALQHYAEQINESGAYPYAAIYSRPLNTLDAEAQPSDILLFRFQRETKRYEAMDQNDPLFYSLAGAFDCSYTRFVKETPDQYDSLPEKESRETEIFYRLCRHQVNIMDGWIPFPAKALAETANLSIFVVCRELKQLEAKGLIEKESVVTDAEYPPVTGWMVTEKGTKMPEYEKAWQEEKEICRRVFGESMFPPDE